MRVRPIDAGLWAWVLVLIASPGVPHLVGESEQIQFSSEQSEPPQVGPTSVIDEQHLWVGLVFTTDGGATWTARIPPRNGEYVDRLPYSQSTLFISVDRGWLGGTRAVWKTTNMGRDWVKVLDGQMYGIGLHDKRGWMAVGDSQHLNNYVTRDAGDTWNQCGSGWKPEIAAPEAWASFVDRDNGWVLVASFDQRGRRQKEGIAQTFNGGCAWTVRWIDPSESGGRLATVRFVDRSLGWLIADHGRLLKSSDGGAHWHNLMLPTSTFGIEDGYVVDQARGWILGSDAQAAPTQSGMYYTADSGIHWRSIPKSDLRSNMGLAREIPRSWEGGILEKILVMHETGKRGSLLTPR